MLIEGIKYFFTSSKTKANIKVRFSNGVKVNIALCLEKSSSKMFMLPLSSLKLLRNKLLYT